MFFLQSKPFPYQMASLCYIVCSSRNDIAVRITVLQALLDLKQTRYIFSYAKYIEVTDKWGRYRNGFKMPNSVMLEHIQVLDSKATWIYWWSKRGGTKIRIN